MQSVSHSNQLNSVESAILGNHLEEFTQIRGNGFQPEGLVRLLSGWPKVKSEFKLQVVADTMLSHYAQQREFAGTLSALMERLNDSAKQSACHRLGKIIDQWMHQRWRSLPCARLALEEAHRLFPRQALAPPTIVLPEKPFFTCYSLFKGFAGKRLERPTDWQGALDGFSALLDHIPQPKSMHVIGYGDGRELLALSQKWPNTAICGFETSKKEQVAIPSPNVTVYHDHYRRTDQVVDLILIRHPNCIGDKEMWAGILHKALQTLSENGTLLLTFYSEKEMRALKEQFLLEDEGDFVWEERVNPYAYNPFFISESGSYSFDLFLATVRPKGANGPNFLQELKATKMRQEEERQLNIEPRRQKFVVVDHPHSIVITSPGFHENLHRDKLRGEPQTCFICRNAVDNYFRAFTRVAGKLPVAVNADFCPRDMPATEAEWEKALKEEPLSQWRDQKPRVHQYFLVSQSIPK